MGSNRIWLFHTTAHGVCGTFHAQVAFWVWLLIGKPVILIIGGTGDEPIAMRHGRDKVRHRRMAMPVATFTSAAVAFCLPVTEVTWPSAFRAWITMRPEG